MKLTFEQTEDDIMDLSRHNMKKSSVMKRVWIFLGGVLLINVYLLSLMEGIQIENILSWAVPVVLIVLIWYIIMRILLKRRFQNPANKRMMIGTREIELSTDEIKVKTPVAKTFYQWSAVTKLGHSHYILQQASYALRMQTVEPTFGTLQQH